MEFSLLGAAVLAYAAMMLASRKTQLETRPSTSEMIMGSAMVGLVVGRVWYMLGTGTNPLTHLGDLLLVRAGVSTIGASVGFLAVIVWQYRSESSTALAQIAAPVLVGLGGWELGCLIRGTCLGVESTVGFVGESGVTRHPIGVYTGLLFVAGALLMWYLQRLELKPWVGPLAFAVAALARAVTEPFRLHFGEGLLWWYLGAGLAGLIAARISRKQLATVDGSTNS